MPIILEGSENLGYKEQLHFNGSVYSRLQQSAEMSPHILSLFCFSLALVVARGLHLPSYIKACKIKSPDFSECAVKNGNAAIPSIVNGEKSLGIPTFNPLVVPFMALSSGSLQLNGTDTLVKGLSGLRLTDAKMNMETKELFLKGTCPELDLDLNYRTAGKIASLPIEGEGKGKVIFSNPVLSYKFKIGETERKGVKYGEVLKPEEAEIIPTKLSIDMRGLFNGNKALEDNMNKFLNENWEVVLDELRPAIVELIKSILRSIFIPITKNVPLQEIFPDW